MKLAWCLGWGRLWAQWARATWLYMGILTIGHAQTNDQGTLVLSGTITKTTCVLNFGDAQSTLGGRKTLSFGSIPPSLIPVASAKFFRDVAPRKTVILSVTNADGNTCDGIGSGKWDVGISIDPARISGNTALFSDGDRNATPRTFTEEIGIVLETAINTTVGNNTVFLNIKNFTPVGGAGTFTLLSDSNATAPQLLATDKLAVSAQFLTLTAGTKAPGAYTVAIPLTVFYQ